MAKKKSNKGKPEIEIGRNMAIVIGLIVLLGGWYILSNPITTGVIAVLGLIVVGIIAVGHYFGGGIAGLLSKIK